MKPSNEYNLVLKACSGYPSTLGILNAMEALARKEAIPTIFNGISRAIVARNTDMLALAVHRLRRARPNLFDFDDIKASDEYLKQHDPMYGVKS